MTDFITGLPQLIATSGVMGAGGEHLGNSRQTQVQAQAQAHGQTQAPTIPSNTTVAADTALPGNSGQQAPASAASTPLPVPTPAETSAAYKAIEKLKAQTAALSPDQQQQLDAAEKTFARKTEDNILKQQAAIEKRGGTLHPTTAKALSDAQGKLGPKGTASSTPSSSGSLPPGSTSTSHGVTTPACTSSGDAAPPSAASSSSQSPIPHPTTQSRPGSGQPAQTPSAPASPQLPVPTRAEASVAHQTIDKLKAQKSPLSPDQQAELNAAEKTFARKTEDNILKQQAAIEARGGKLHDKTAKALADAQAKLAPKNPDSPAHPSDGTRHPDVNPDTRARSETPSADGARQSVPEGTEQPHLAESAPPRRPHGDSQLPRDAPRDTDTEAPPNGRPSGESPPPQPALRDSTPPHSVPQSQRSVADNEQKHDAPEDLAKADAFEPASHAGSAVGPREADGYRADSGTPAYSQGSPFPGPISPKTHAERQVENLHLLTTRPPRKSPFSNKVRVAVQGVHGEVLRKAAILIDHAHDDGGTTELIMKDKVTKANTLGNYLDGTANVRPDGPHPLMTSFHETGHHVAMTMLDDAALERVRDVASDTPRWDELFELNKNTSGFDLQYYIDPHEVFARAYAQTIAMRTKDVESLTEMEWILNHPQAYFKQWPATQFTRLQKAVEAELHKIEWL